MPDSKEVNNDIKLVEILTNKPSEPILIENSKVRVVFKAPAFTDKYRGRSWASKKLKEIGIENEEDQDLSYYFRYWGTLNVYVKDLYVENSSGDFKIEGKNYSLYIYDSSKDLDYKFMFEKYVLEEMYSRGLDEQFVTAVILAHMNWVRTRALEEVDIKKS